MQGNAILTAVMKFSNISEGVATAADYLMLLAFNTGVGACVCARVK